MPFIISNFSKSKSLVFASFCPRALARVKTDKKNNWLFRSLFQKPHRHTGFLKSDFRCAPSRARLSAMNVRTAWPCQTHTSFHTAPTFSSRNWKREFQEFFGGGWENLYNVSRRKTWKEETMENVPLPYVEQKVPWNWAAYANKQVFFIKNAWQGRWQLQHGLMKIVVVQKRHNFSVPTLQVVRKTKQNPKQQNPLPIYQHIKLGL